MNTPYRAFLGAREGLARAETDVAAALALHFHTTLRSRFTREELRGAIIRLRLARGAAWAAVQSHLAGEWLQAAEQRDFDRRTA